MGKRTEDIFDIVSRHKKDIDDRQATVDRRESKAKRDAELLAERMKDPIFREQEKIRRRAEKTVGSTCSRRKVLAGREKLGLPLNLDPISENNHQKSFNLNRKRQFIVAMTKPAYHCPRCGECKTKMSEWFVSPKIKGSTDARKVQCRSCVLAFGWEIDKPLEKIPIPFAKIKPYTSIVRYYKIDAIDLCRKRVSAGCSVKNFAELVGWAASYQYRLENGGVRKLNKQAMDDLIEAFNRKGVYIVRSIWGRARERYILDGKVIRELRIRLGMSQSQFSKKAGWSAPYQNKIELSSEFGVNKRKTSVNKGTMDIIQKILNQSV